MRLNNIKYAVVARKHRPRYFSLRNAKTNDGIKIIINPIGLKIPILELHKTNEFNISPSVLLKIKGNKMNACTINSTKKIKPPSRNTL